MAQFGRRGVSYTPFFSEGMGAVSEAMMGRRAEERQNEENALAADAYMGNPEAIQTLAQMNPELAMQIEDQSAQRKETETQRGMEKDKAFADEMKSAMTAIGSFDTFEEAQAYGQRMTDAMVQKYPDRMRQQGFPEEFNQQAFDEIRTITGGLRSGKPVGVPFRATLPDGTAVMAQQTQLPNGGTETTYLKDQSGQLVKPAEYDLGLAGALAGAKGAGKITGEAGATIETAAPVAQAETEAAAAAQAGVDLPAFAEQSNASINAMNGIRNDPALDSITGAAWLNPAKLVPGTDAYDLMQRMRQMEGKVFAQAYETLKGGGPITEIESAEAKAAIARMSTAQSKESYLEALDDFEASIRRAYKLKAQEAAGDFTAAPLVAPSGLASEFTRNNPAKPTTDEEFSALPAGAVYIDPDDGRLYTK